PEVKAIRAFTDVLPESVGHRKYTKLSDGITKRSYIIAEVYMMNGKHLNIIEVESERRSLSTIILSSYSILNCRTFCTFNLFNNIDVERVRCSLTSLILSSSSKQNWSAICNYILLNLVNASGNWTRKSLNSINTKGIKIEKTKHSSKGVQHRAGILLGKLL